MMYDCTCPHGVVEHQLGCMYRAPMRVLVNGTPIELWGIEQRLARIEKLLELIVEKF